MPTTIKTPHAAIKIWNYADRITDTGTTGQPNKISEQIISTVSCIGIQTSKNKGDPVGTFNFILAPTRNWVSVITPGSWCAIMMSNNPITADAWSKADKSLIKMVGRIDTVRVEVAVDDNGARQTRYLVSGKDWGAIFNNVLYIDPLINDPKVGSGVEGNALYVALIEFLNRQGIPEKIKINENLQMLLSVFGQPLNVPDTEGRKAKATHSISFPSEMADFFQFVDAADKPSNQIDISQLIKLQSGSLLDQENEGVYETKISDGQGWINPFSLAGTHTMWSILADNSNYALNELYPEMRWLDNGPQLTLYNRIKPFSFQKEAVDNIDTKLRSKFQNVVSHQIDKNLITSVNAGTNWSDKFNFIEIKPDIAELHVLDTLVKEKSQAYKRDDPNIFDREGFRPLIFTIKQYPFLAAVTTDDRTDAALLQKWVNLLQEWYFDSHRLLNGRLEMTGSTEYIPVGDNIMFDAELIGVAHNYNSDAVSQNDRIWVLAHVESVQHNFAVNNEGARQFQTKIQFVRGIIVDESKNLIGEGTIDTLSSDLQFANSKNSITTTVKATSDNPKDSE